MCYNDVVNSALTLQFAHCRKQPARRRRVPHRTCSLATLFFLLPHQQTCASLSLALSSEGQLL